MGKYCDFATQLATTVRQNGLYIKRGAVSIVDDGTHDLPDAKSQIVRVWVDGDDEFGIFHVNADGTVILMSYTGSVVNSDTDTNLCVYNSAGTQATIKNRLGSTKTINYETEYTA